MIHKNAIIHIGFLFSLLIAFVSCVDSITPNLNKSDTKALLVVEGQITDQVGPFRVKLTNSGPLKNMHPPTPVLYADVIIADNQGNSFRLYGDFQGLYETRDKNLKGIPGNIYTLYITTADDGLQYTSTPVMMQDVPGIDSLYFEEVTHTRFLQRLTFEDNWLNILLDSHDAKGKNKYWRYEFEETFEGNLVLGAIYDEQKCWLTNPSAVILLASTVNNPVDEIKGFPVQSIGPGDARLAVRYSILVTQYSIDAEVYNYLKRLKDINEDSGGIYNKIPAPVFGNITCSDDAAKALGYFSASSVKKKRLFIKRSEHHVETINMFEYCKNGSCASCPHLRPSFW